MKIEKDSLMLLFRYSNFRGYSFVEEHRKALKEKKYVWLLKLGKRSSVEKLTNVLNSGGWMVLRSPKAEGSRSYLCHFTEVSEELPKTNCYPDYYKYVLAEAKENEYLNPNQYYQWFKVDLLKELGEKEAAQLYVANNKKFVDEVIGTTRTAVMFIKNGTSIDT